MITQCRITFFTRMSVLLPTLALMTTAQTNDIKIGSAAYFKEYTGVTSYEVSAKLIQTVKLPTFVANNPGSCDASNVQCLSEKSIFDRKQEWNAMFYGNSTVANAPKRTKRQAVVIAALAGFLLHSIYTSLSKKMFASDDEANQHIQTIWTSMQAQQHQFLVFQSEMELYGQNISRAINATWWYDTTLERQSRSQLFLTQVNQYMDRLHFGLARCSNNLIPFEFISKDSFKSKLMDIEKHASTSGYSLSIRADRIDEYNDLNIADCVFTESGVIILLNIPMTKNSWKVTEMIPVPFGYNNQTCVLESRSTDLVAVSKDQVKIIDLNSRQFCDLVHDKLCLVPIFQRPTEQSALCASYVYSKSTTENLGSACQFKCFPNQNLTVTHLDHNLIPVANGKSLAVQCPDTSRHMPLHRFGAVSIALKCNCTYKVDNKAIDTFGSCFDQLFSFDDISTTIPHFLLSPSLTSTNFDLHHNWTKMIPILNFTKSQDNPTATFGLFDDKLTNTHRDVILITNSTIATFLFVFAVVMCIVLWKNLHK